MRTLRLLSAVFISSLATFALAGDPPAVTVYNQRFGVVREKIALDLKSGVNPLRFSDIAAHVEPDSVILRDPSGKVRLQILEQNYRNDPVSQERLVALFEGQTIDFVMYDEKAPNHERLIRGKIVRSGYVSHPQAWSAYGQQYAQAQSAYMGGGGSVPIIEIDGKLRFGLPGTPIFPSLADDTILKPTFEWLIETDAGGKLDAELSYVTGGMSWKADYNVVSPEKSDTLDLAGWVTIDNQTGKTFESARIKLMAGDVSKLQPEQAGRHLYAMDERSAGVGGMAPPVSEKAFDEYHLYTLRRATTLRDSETKQVEFVRASGIQSQRLYVYDGAKMEQRWQNYDVASLRIQKEFGTQCNPKVWVMREFDNSEKNQLGMPLPAGRLRFYRSDADGQLEFTGENEIDHTPKDEKVRIYTGNAFDLVGERRQTDFKVSNHQDWADEAFEIKVRNHKKEPVEVCIVEHLYRWVNWEIKEKTSDYTKKDARTIEFRVTVPPDGEQTVTYLVHYSW